MVTLVENLAGRRTIVGYCWPWTVRPGEKLDFMVSSNSIEEYRADLVRITCADSLSSPKMFKEHYIESEVSGRYQPRFQPTHLGSYVEISANTVLDQLRN